MTNTHTHSTDTPRRPAFECPACGYSRCHNARDFLDGDPADTRRVCADCGTAERRYTVAQNPAGGWSFYAPDGHAYADARYCHPLIAGRAAEDIERLEDREHTPRRAERRATPRSTPERRADAARAWAAAAYGEDA